MAFFQDLYHTHQSDLVRFAERRVGRNIGEDLVEETFLYAWWKIAELRGHPVPKKWLYATLLNRCRHGIARKSFQSEIATDLTELPISTELECGLLEVLPKGLSEGELQVLALRFEQRLDFDLIAERLGIREDAARKRVSRAVAKMRELLLRAPGAKK